MKKKSTRAKPLKRHVKAKDKSQKAQQKAEDSFSVLLGQATEGHEYAARCLADALVTGITYLDWIMDLHPEMIQRIARNEFTWPCIINKFQKDKSAEKIRKQIQLGEDVSIPDNKRCHSQYPVQIAIDAVMWADMLHRGDWDFTTEKVDDFRKLPQLTTATFPLWWDLTIKDNVDAALDANRSWMRQGSDRANDYDKEYKLKNDFRKKVKRAILRLLAAREKKQTSRAE